MLQTNGTVGGTGFSGPITIDGVVTSGGHFSGPNDATLTISILESYGRKAQLIGRAVPDPDRQVHIRERKLVGHHKTFRNEDRYV